MIIISDTTAFSELAKVGQMNLLRDVFGQVIIPQEVYNEITTGFHPAAELVQEANWLEIIGVKNPQQVNQLQLEYDLDLGECAAIVLAQELNADLLLIDERSARQLALLMNIKIIGMVGVLLLAKQRGLITSVKQILDQLIENGTRISKQLYQYALITAEEC